jgi:hypothetical protein
LRKKNTGSHLGRPGHGLTCWVNRVWPSHCTGWSFDKPGSIQLLGQPGFGSTYQAGPGLITMVSIGENITIARAHEISILPSCIFFPSRWVRQTISIMHLWVRETISMRPFPSCIYESHVMHLWVLYEFLRPFPTCIYESICPWDHCHLHIGPFFLKERPWDVLFQPSCIFSTRWGRTLGALKAMVFNFIMLCLEWQVYFILI